MKEIIINFIYKLIIFLFLYFLVIYIAKIDKNITYDILTIFVLIGMIDVSDFIVRIIKWIVKN